MKTSSKNPVIIIFGSAGGVYIAEGEPGDIDVIYHGVNEEGVIAAIRDAYPKWGEKPLDLHPELAQSFYKTVEITVPFPKGTPAPSVRVLSGACTIKPMAIDTLSANIRAFRSNKKPLQERLQQKGSLYTRVTLSGDGGKFKDYTGAGTTALRNALRKSPRALDAIRDQAPRVGNLLMRLAEREIVLPDNHPIRLGSQGGGGSSVVAEIDFRDDTIRSCYGGYSVPADEIL